MEKNMRTNRRWEIFFKDFNNELSKCPFHFYRLVMVTYSWFHSAMNLFVDPPREWALYFGWEWYAKKQYVWPLSGDKEDPAYFVGHVVGVIVFALLLAFEIWTICLAIKEIFF